MRLATKIKRLERFAAGGARCEVCGLPRAGWPSGARLAVQGPEVVTHISEVVPVAAPRPCHACGRASVFVIPSPDPAREKQEAA